jgi:hypothetical protein
MMIYKICLYFNMGDFMEKDKELPPPPESVVKELCDYVEKYITALTYIPHGDPRDPPGKHSGTGWLVQDSNGPILATCEHVARAQSSGKIGYSCFGCEYGISLNNQFSLYPFDIDFAKADIENTFRGVMHKGKWFEIKHQGECTTIDHYAENHCPVEDEYLYVYGFPGADAVAGFGQHEMRGMSVFLREVEFDPENFSEIPFPIKGKHICCAWNPKLAIALLDTQGDLSLPPGMSGSPLWNTRYVEVTKAGGKWTPQDARITGIVWGHSSKSCQLFATPVEMFRNIIFE